MSINKEQIKAAIEAQHGAQVMKTYAVAFKSNSLIHVISKTETSDYNKANKKAMNMSGIAYGAYFVIELVKIEEKKQ